MTFAQDSSSHEVNNSFGVVLGAGLGVGGGTVSAEAGVPLASGLVSLRYLHTAGASWDKPGKDLREVGILYGFTKTTDRSLSAFSFGVSYLHFENWSTTVYMEQRETVGIPLVGQHFVRIVDNLKWGFIVYGNINTYRLYGGFLVCLRIEV
jgi:hypothetical protein